MFTSRTKRFKNNKSVKQTQSIKKIVKKVRENNSITLEEVGCSAEELNFAHTILTSEEFVENFTKDGSRYLCARLRPGFIGEKINVSGGASYIQAERGKPFGSVVAIPNSKGTVTIGVSYTEDEPMEHPYPVVGLASALKQAIAARDNGSEFFNSKLVKPNAVAQIEYFTKRALAYFNPEVYSYSRGQEGKKVVYENYDEIHNRREKILGTEKLESSKPKSKHKK